jgi:tetratricopeptide (TPR) repeat protein/predicted Ser/Thr protein kinase
MSGVAPLLPRFGKYKTVRRLGKGGMGEVYLATDPELGRQVAIKVLLDDSMPDAAHRLTMEARAIAALDHEFIAAVYETGISAEGHAYIVMQYVAGETLQELLKSGPLPLHRATSICADIASALAAAHHAGVIHRDLKPSNVIITPGGRPKLLDFGIARWRPAHVNEDFTTFVATAAGAVLGTFGYMSPEQMIQSTIDERSDLFSLGAVFFECLTGRAPFGGATTFEVIANVLNADPPDMVSLNPALTARHSAVCLRLLAKAPTNRFQSAAEALGALHTVNVPEVNADQPNQPEQKSVRVWFRLAVTAALVLLAVSGYWAVKRNNSLPPVPIEAAEWYQRGIDQIREGAYQSAARALERAVAIFPRNALAYARLAEAHAELDDENAAREDLLHVASLVDESNLAIDDGARLVAVRSLVLRDIDSAIKAYRELTTRHPDDAGAWLDLGRAQDAAGFRNDARESYLRAIERNVQYAPAYLRLASVEAAASRFAEAEDALGHAEELYIAGSSTEGRAEVLLRRGAMLDSKGEPAAARQALEQCLQLSNTASTPLQQIRARLALSAVTASEGRLKESEAMASAAVQRAIDTGLQTVAADGLTDLSATLLEGGKLEAAEEQARRALTLAEQRQAKRTMARAKVQLAAVVQESGHGGETLALLDSVLPFLVAGQYRRLELLALSIESRAFEQQDRLAQALEVSERVLAVAESVKDDNQIAIAASNQASVLASLGQYPSALAMRERAERIRRAQGDRLSLPYDLANRAELLIRLGRSAEAEPLLSEIDAGIAAHLDTYIGRTSRVRLLRGLADAVNLRCTEVVERFVGVTTPSTSGSARALTPALVSYCQARLGRTGFALPVGVDRQVDPANARERQYWIAATLLQQKHAAESLSTAKQGLADLGEISNDELRWRLAAVGTLAAAAERDSENVVELQRAGVAAWQRLATDWGPSLLRYESRPDVSELRQRVLLIWGRSK